MKIYEVEITVRMRVQAETIADANVQGREMLECGTWHEMTEIRARLIGAVVREEEKSPIEILKQRAKRQCVDCSDGIPAAKDPKLGWMHATAEELREQGSHALRYCTARGTLDDILELERIQEQ